MQKWSYETHRYEPYDAPKGVMLFSTDMDAVCSCASCGREMTFGEGYTSMEIQNQTGFGYCVCKDCYKQELDRRFTND